MSLPVHHDMDCGQIHIHVTGPWKVLTNGKVIMTCCTETCWCQPRAIEDSTGSP